MLNRNRPTEYICIASACLIQRNLSSRHCWLNDTTFQRSGVVHDHAKQPRITSLIDTFADWLKHRRELNEIRQLGRGEFDRIAADLEISSSELEELARRGLHAADELPLLLEALENDEA